MGKKAETVECEDGWVRQRVTFVAANRRNLKNNYIERCNLLCAPHDGICGNGVTTPLILNLDLYSQFQSLPALPSPEG
jgi:hypothetical protein